MLPTIQIGTISISTYVVALVITAIFSIASVYHRRDYYRLREKDSLFLGLLLDLLGIFLGGKLLFILLNLEYVCGNGISLFGGQTIFGSIFFLPIVAGPIGKRFGLRRHQILDLCAPCVAAAVGVQAIGCYLSNCCLGRQVCFGDMYFRLPTQAFESICGFLLFYLLIQKEKTGEWVGRHYPVMMIGYGMLRFVSEFFRTTEKNILYLSQWQWLAIVTFFAGIIWNFAVIQKKVSRNEVYEKKEKTI